MYMYKLLVIFLLSMIVGMIVALINKPKYIYHGPNAEQQSKKIFYNHVTKKCYRFIVKPINCKSQK